MTKSSIQSPTDNPEGALGPVSAKSHPMNGQARAMEHSAGVPPAAGEVAPHLSSAKLEAPSLIYSYKHTTHSIKIPKDTRGEAMGMGGGSEGDGNVVRGKGIRWKPLNPEEPHNYLHLHI